MVTGETNRSCRYPSLALVCPPGQTGLWWKTPSRVEYPLSRCVKTVPLLRVRGARLCVFSLEEEAEEEEEEEEEEVNTGLVHSPVQDTPSGSHHWSNVFSRRCQGWGQNQEPHGAASLPSEQEGVDKVSVESHE